MIHNFSEQFWSREWVTLCYCFFSVSGVSMLRAPGSVSREVWIISMRRRATWWQLLSTWRMISPLTLPADRGNFMMLWRQLELSPLFKNYIFTCFAGILREIHSWRNEIYFWVFWLTYSLWVADSDLYLPFQNFLFNPKTVSN